jgi:hypothetical protein
MGINDEVSKQINYIQQKLYLKIEKTARRTKQDEILEVANH